MTSADIAWVLTILIICLTYLCVKIATLLIGD